MIVYLVRHPKAVLGFALFLAAAWLIHDIPTVVFYGLAAVVIGATAAWILVVQSRPVGMSVEDVHALVASDDWAPGNVAELGSSSPEPVDYPDSVVTPDPDAAVVVGHD